MEFRDQVTKFSRLLRSMLDSPMILFRDLKPSSLPDKAGVYRIFESTAVFPKTLYVGETQNLRNRIYRSHLMGNVDVSALNKKLVGRRRYPNADAVKDYLRLDCCLQFIRVPSKQERMRLEHFVIAMLGPDFND